MAVSGFSKRIPLGADRMIMISGQSNGKGTSPRSYLWSGAGASFTPLPTREFQRVYIWNPTHSAFEKLQVGTVASDGSGGGNNLGMEGADHPMGYEDGFGPEIGIAQRWEQEQAGILYIVKYAVGGSTISHWKDGGDYYTTLAGYITAAKAAMPDIPISGFIWDQGESDFANAAYYDDLTAMMATYHTNFLYKTARIAIAGKTAVATAQAGFINHGFNNRHAAIYDTSGYAKIDADHYTGAEMFVHSGKETYNILFETTGEIS